jgi:hypothetical protein
MVGGLDLKVVEEGRDHMCALVVAEVAYAVLA